MQSGWVNQHERPRIQQNNIVQGNARPSRHAAGFFLRPSRPCRKGSPRHTQKRCTVPSGVQQSRIDHFLQQPAQPRPQQHALLNPHLVGRAVQHEHQPALTCQQTPLLERQPAVGERCWRWEQGRRHGRPDQQRQRRHNQNAPQRAFHHAHASCTRWVYFKPLPVKKSTTRSSGAIQPSRTRC